MSETFNENFIDSVSELKKYLEQYEKLKSCKKRKSTVTIEKEILFYVEKILKQCENEGKRSKVFYNVSCSSEWSEVIILSLELLLSTNDIKIKIYEMIYQCLERQCFVISKEYLSNIIFKWNKASDKIDIKNKASYMRCLASFIYGNITIMHKEQFLTLTNYFFKETEISLQNVNKDDNDINILKYCISGLTNLCYIPENGVRDDDFLSKRFQLCAKFYNMFAECLERSIDQLTELSQISLFRFSHQCLHGLNYICRRPHGISMENIVKLMKILRNFCGYSLFQIVKDSTTLSTETEELTQNFSCVLIESTDDCNSDVNALSLSTNSRSTVGWEKKTRKLALELLLKLIDKSSKKISTEMWSQYMPFSTFGSRRFNLLNLLEKEKDVYLKQMILTAIQSFILNCKELLLTAQYQSGSSAYLSKSHNFGIVVYDIHRRFLSQLESEELGKIGISLLKCLSSLIKTVQYQKLQGGIITMIIMSLRRIFMKTNKNSVQLRCAILECFTELVSLETVSNEINELLLNPPPVSITDAENLSLFPSSINQNAMKSSWLVQLCLRLAHSSLVDSLWNTALYPEFWDNEIDELVGKIISEGVECADNAVRSQALTTIGAMLMHHVTLIRPSLDTLKRTLYGCLQESLENKCTEKNKETSLRVQVLKVFSGFLSTLENKKERRYIGVVQNSEKPDFILRDVWGPLHFSGGDSSSIVLMRDWWITFLDSVLGCLDDEDDKVRWAAAQSLSLASESVLMEVLTPDQLNKACQRLLSLFNDANIGVACQAVWALGYWVVMRPLRIDCKFLNQLEAACTGVLLQTNASNGIVGQQSHQCRYSVSANAAWVLGNLGELLAAHADALLDCCNTGECITVIETYSAYPPHRLTHLMQLLVNCCLGNNATGINNATAKIAAVARLQENCVRGLGLLCRFLRPANLLSDSDLRNSLTAASQTFTQCFQLPDKVGKVKVKWNACLSVSQIFQNPILLTSNKSEDFDPIRITELLSGLVHSVASERYFKVRNNSLLSILTYLQSISQLPISFRNDLRLKDLLLIPLAKACLSITQISSVSFSEVHRYCLCLYMLHYSLLKLLSLLSPGELNSLTSTPTSLYLFQELQQDHLPLIWQHLMNINRSFNKSALLPRTLTMQPAISAEKCEVDSVVSEMRKKCEVSSTTVTQDINSNARDLIKEICLCVESTRPLDDTNDSSWDNSQAYNYTNGTEDEGLMTKRIGSTLLFNQVYD